MDTTVLGPFEVGQAPIIIATVTDATGNNGISLSTRWTVTDPEDEETQYQSGIDSEISNPSNNLWKFQLPTLELVGMYLIRCESLTGVISSHTQRLGVTHVKRG